MNKKESDYKKLVNNQKDSFNNESNKVSDETNDNQAKINEFNTHKKMKWWSYLISLSIAVFITGFSFLIGYLTRNTSKMPDYQGTGWVSLICGVLLLIAILVIEYIKHNDAKNYFNDKRRRYQHTFNLLEAKLILTNKILILGLILTLATIIATNVVYN